MASYPNRVRSCLKLDEQCSIVCGLALGYADEAAPVNQAQTTRCDLEDYFRVIT